MKRVLITGVAGFIGSNLAKSLLAEGYDVIGIDNLYGGTRENVPSGVKSYVIDIRGEIRSLFAGVDTVFHLAAKTNLPDCRRDPVAASDVNAGGTVNVLEAARVAGVRKFIYADTSAEYEGITDLPTGVDKICPISPYAVSKRGGALFCESYQRLYGMDITVLRYFNVYGPAQDWRRVFAPVMSAFITKLLRGERPSIYGTGKKRRDFIYVDDVNALHLRVMQNDHTAGRVYNVGSGINYSVSEIFEMIESILKTGLEPIYEADLIGEAEATLADISDSIRLGWEPRIHLDVGLRRSIEYLRERVSRES